MRDYICADAGIASGLGRSESEGGSGVEAVSAWAFLVCGTAC